MAGSDLLEELRDRLVTQSSTAKISDAALARHLGITANALIGYRDKTLTTKQVANLLDSAAAARSERLVNDAVVPVIEFLPLKPQETTQGKSWRIFSPAPSGRPNRYLVALKHRLETCHGVYVFHDSRGRAIYAGKAQLLTLWTEINNAFNRDRKEVQSIKRVYHPIGKGSFAARERQIARETVALHHLAAYVSAYEVAEPLIGKVEALLVRTFANDLLNVRMEHF